MILFSRSFIRKRVISLSTTATVAAASLVLSHDRTRAFHVHGVLPVQYVANRSDRSAPQPFRADERCRHQQDDAGDGRRADR